MSDIDIKWCICADPENCTERVPGYKCKADYLPKSEAQNAAQWLRHLNERREG